MTSDPRSDPLRPALRQRQTAAGVDPDLRYRLGPILPVLERLDPLVRQPINLTPAEVNDLVKFVGDSLLDNRANKANLCRLIPPTVPSGLPVLDFQGCGK